MSGAFIKDGFLYVPLYEGGKPIDPATLKADKGFFDWIEQQVQAVRKPVRVRYASARRAQNRAWRAWAQLCRYREWPHDPGPRPHPLCAELNGRRCMERVCPKPFHCTRCRAKLDGELCFVDSFQFGVGVRDCLCPACAQRVHVDERCAML